MIEQKSDIQSSPPPHDDRHPQSTRLSQESRVSILEPRLNHSSLLSTNTQTYLFSGLNEGCGVEEMMPSDAAPASPEVCDRLTGFHVFIIQHVPMIVQDAAAGQLAATSSRPCPHHLTVQCHHCSWAGAETRRTSTTGWRTGFRGEATVHLPAISKGRDHRVVVSCSRH